MAIIGQGVQAGLGRIDYSPYMQGAVAGAQGIAQGLASLGQNVAKGFEQYALKQEKKKQEESATNTVANIFKASPFLAKSLNIPQDQNGEFDKGALKDFIKVYGPGQAVQVASALDQMNRAQQAQEDQRKAAQVAAYLQQGGGNLPSPVNRNAFTSEQQIAGERSYLELARQRAERDKTLAEAAALRVGKPVQGFGTGAEAFAEAKKMLKDAPGMQASFSTAGGRHFPELVKAPQPAFEDAEARLSAERASKQMDTFEKGIADAFSAADSASLVINALDKGETTGMFAPLSSFVSRALNLNDASQKTLLEKGVAGLSAQQVASLARGLGSMSNADREFFTATAPKLTDPTKANRFYAEMALENAKFAREDQDYIAMREAEGVGTKQILRELNKRAAGRNVAQSVYARVIGGLSPNAAQFTN
jgi:hypothetical protein